MARSPPSVACSSDGGRHTGPVRVRRESRMIRFHTLAARAWLAPSIQDRRRWLQHARLREAATSTFSRLGPLIRVVALFVKHADDCGSDSERRASAGFEESLDGTRGIVLRTATPVISSRDLFLS